MQHALVREETEGKQPFGKPKLRCVNNIKMDLKEIELSLGRTQLDVVKAVLSLRVSGNAGNLLTF